MIRILAIATVAYDLLRDNITIGTCARVFAVCTVVVLGIVLVG